MLRRATPTLPTRGLAPTAVTILALTGACAAASSDPTADTDLVTSSGPGTTKGAETPPGVDTTAPDPGESGGDDTKGGSGPTTDDPSPVPDLDPAGGDDFAERCAAAGVIFCDDFESGDLGHQQGYAGWTSATSVTVTDERSTSGSHAARFHFAGTPSLDADADAFSELRFDLGDAHPELWLTYALYVPANYAHRDAESSDNNKFFRLWGTDYDDPEKVGASMWPERTQDSHLLADWSHQGEGIGPKGEGAAGFIGPDDHGSWMDVRIHVVAATDASLGTIQVWKNDVLVVDATGEVDNFAAEGIHAHRYGYLLGWSNSGFTEDTDLFIDDVLVTTVDPMGGG